LDANERDDVAVLLDADLEVMSVVEGEDAFEDEERGAVMHVGAAAADRVGQVDNNGASIVAAGWCGAVDGEGAVGYLVVGLDDAAGSG